MEKSNKICIAVIVTCFVLVIAFCGFLILNHKEETISDAIKFKDEYEALNDKTTKDGKRNYPSVNIAEENPIIYKSATEIVDILNNEDAVVYFGFSACPWCRNVVESLLQVAKDNNLEKIYYVDILDIRDAYEYDGSMVPKKTKDGSEGYYKILEFLDKSLEKYYIKDEKGNKYDTGVKRLYAPTIVAVANKKVVDIHVGTVESQENPYEKINTEQQKELYDILDKLVKEVKQNNICTDNAC